MNEQYLHFLWHQKRLPFHQLKLSNGGDINVVSTGTHNALESGPDFFCAQLTMDGMHWVGNVEIHIRSSDWYAHGHHHDSAYDNVILHVVLYHDKEVYVHGRALPTLELHSFIDDQHLKKFDVFKSTKIPCANFLNTKTSMPFFDLIQASLISRYQRKVKSKNTNDTMQWFYTLLGKSFGAKVNELPFEVITNLVPWYALKQLDPQERFYRIRVASNLFPELNVSLGQEEFSPIQISWWKRKGLNATSTPQNRVLQFAAFMAYLNEDFSFVSWRTQEVIAHFHRCFQHAFSNFGIGIKIKQSFILRNLFINAVVPVLFFFEQVQTALELLKSLGPENNYIIRAFKAVKVIPSNAAESQMISEVYRQFCARKKCLNCAVGKYILSS